MAVRKASYAGIDGNIAANLRIYREQSNLSQEDVAEAMTDSGFAFSQTTVWKIESGQRPVKAIELVALADCLQIASPMSLTYEPAVSRHLAQMRQANQKAFDAYAALKEAAADYLHAQMDLLVVAYEAREDGMALADWDTAWLDTLAEQAVIEARVELDRADGESMAITDAVGQVVAALRTGGFDPALRLEDVHPIGEGTSPRLDPGQPEGS
jgi:transcriptional regulator with XRE-family HTH domain